MAFDSLSDRLKGIIKSLKGQSRLTENNMDAMLKEIQMALLEADVNFKVVREFIASIKEKALGAKVLEELNPSQTVVKIVREELIALFGEDVSGFTYKSHPSVIMLVGLQGTGKTTTAGKIAKYMRADDKKNPLLVAADIYRPAAIDQLRTIANDNQLSFFTLGDKVKPEDIAIKALEKAKEEKYDAVIVDTAGRLHIDDQLMDELKEIKNRTHPDEILLLVDAMSGQDAVNTALAFYEKVGVTGVIMSKLDGDARGGAALSIRKLTGVPVKFIGTGEKIDDLEAFHPERMVDRILGMGDVVTLIEQAQKKIDEKEAKKTANRMMKGEFDLNDMLAQLKQLNKLGSLGGILKLIPGMPKISPEQQAIAEKEMKNMEIIINSMTPEERAHPGILRNSRKVRIAKGSGKTSADINRVIKKWEQSKEMMKMMKNYQKGGKIPPGGMF